MSNSDSGVSSCANDPKLHEGLSLASAYGFCRSQPSSLAVVDCPKTKALTGISDLQNGPPLLGVDLQLLCNVFCCCKQNPSIAPKSGQSGYDSCAQQTLKRVDKEMNYQGRYKPQIAYNMENRPPTPWMHREGGVDTTQPSTRWQTRAEQDLGPHYAAKYHGGEYKVRIPDVVVVKDQTQPPTQDNIDFIVEYQFTKQSKAAEETRREDYAYIAGKPNKVIMMGGTKAPCDCEKEQRPEQIMKEITRQVEEAVVSFLLRMLLSLLTRGLVGKKIPVPKRP